MEEAVINNDFNIQDMDVVIEEETLTIDESSSESLHVTADSNLSRKRHREPDKWKKNVAKRAR